MPLPDKRNRPEVDILRAAQETKIRGRGVGSTSSVSETADVGLDDAGLVSEIPTAHGLRILCIRNREERLARQQSLLSPGALAERRGEEGAGTPYEQWLARRSAGRSA